MNNICAAEPCPVILNSTCVFYRGANLVYTGILTNDNFQTVLEKIDNKFKNAAIGYVFNNGIVQSTSGGPVQLGGSLIKDTVINSDDNQLTITGTVNAAKFATIGGTSAQFVKGDGSLDDGGAQRPGAYITALTGDGTANGPGSAVFTLKDVNTQTGTYGSGSAVPIVTVDSKGRITNMSAANITYPAQIISIGGDVYGSGLTGQPTTLTLTTVNSNIYSTNSILKFAVNAKGLVTSAAPITGNDVENLLGYIPVPNSRTLTINGQTYDLSANRSWTITSAATAWGSITGTLTNQTDLTTYLSNNYYPLSSNPAGYLTSSSLSGYIPYYLDNGSGKSIDIGHGTAPLDMFRIGANANYFDGDVNGSSFTADNFLGIYKNVYPPGILYTGKIQANNITTNRTLQFPDQSGTIALTSDISGLVPYTGATGNVNLGLHSIQANTVSAANGTASLSDDGTVSGSSYVFWSAPTPGGQAYGELLATGNTSPHTWTLPNKNGTIALLNDIPTSSGTVTSVGISMPSAFTVSNSPVTTSGTLTVTGAGTASQYIRGDGVLATLPTSGGGGSSVIYYLNGSVNQGTFGGNTYYQMSKTAVTTSPGTDFTIATNGIIARFITDANDPGLLNIPGGNWNMEFYFSSSSSGGSPTFYINVYKYNGGFTLIGTNSTAPEGITNGTTIDSYYTSVTIPTTTLTVTDRLAIEIYVANSGRTITMHTEDNHVSEVITTFSTGLTALNGLTSQVQYFATGTSGSDFGISSATNTHTFNLPTASATNRGALSSSDWTTFNNKQSALSGTGIVKSTSGTISYLTDNSTNWDTAYTDRYKWDGGATGLTASTGRTSLGATTVGGNLFTLTNPSAITFLRINADNTVSTLSASTYRTAIGVGTWGTLDYPTYVSGTPFVKMTAAGTFSLDTNTYLTTNQSITLSGDVSGTGSTAITTSIGSNKVTNAMLAQVATATFKGRTTASTGNVEDLTATQATALLNEFTSTLKGLAPASGGGTTTFLRADGTWATPTSSSGVNGSGSANQLAYWTNGNTINNLNTSTYPNLTEISHVKGVTSAIQTQIDAKQDLSLSAYSIRANNTNATANATDQVFKDIGSQTYTGSITWTGTTPPSGSTTHSYRWTQIGKLVTLNVQLSYGTNGSALTVATFDLPSDCPTPTAPSGISGNSRVLYYGNGNLSGSGQLGAVASRCGLIINATSTGYSLIVASSSSTYNAASITVQYYTS